jgi:hypothetical protein
MQKNKDFVFLGSLLALGLGFGGAHVRAATPTPSFTISAANTTMPASGNGSLPITLTSVDGYAGDIVIRCAPTNPPAGAKLPGCDLVPGPYVALTANQTKWTGSLDLIPYGGSVPPAPASLLHRPASGGAAGLALAGVLLFGLGFDFRRRPARWFTLLLLAAGVLAGVAGIAACGGSGNAMTPGTWPYTVTGIDSVTGATASTTANVTVP